MIGFTKTDGGRAAAGFSTRSGARDCVARAAACALTGGKPTGEDYRRAYRAIADASADAGGKRSARDGVLKKVGDAAYEALGFTKIGLRKKAHGGRNLTLTEAWERYRRPMVFQTTRHRAAICNGRLYDASDIRTCEVEDEWGDVTIKHRKTATVWLAPA